MSKAQESHITAVSFESRMAEEMKKMIEKRQWQVISAPTMQEIPLQKNPEAFQFAEKLLAGRIDVFICMTGVGMKMLLEVLAARYPIEKIIPALSKTTVVARGPKSVKVLGDSNIPITVRISEPNTFHEILEELDENRRSLSLEGKTVAVQEYGIPNEELVAGLKKRGAQVIQVPVYRWALPDNTNPLEQAIREVCEGKVQVSFFTNSMQIRYALKVAAQMGAEENFRKALNQTVVVSIGPTCSEALQESGMSVDFEPSHSKLGQMVTETASKITELIEEKKQLQVSPVLARKKEETSSEKEKRRKESIFLKACRLEKTEKTPVWLMRQAGRYMKEYRRIRDKVSFIELCRNPELCCQVTVEACEKIKADAAIIFSDILLIVESLGLDLEYSKGDGPVITGHVSNAQEIDRLPEVDAASLSYVYDALKLTRSCLDSQTPLLGFCGAPFTLASYILEGGSSRNFIKTKQLMISDPGAWKALLEKISRGLLSYLKLQIQAGADALQIFDSWVGCLSPADYRHYVLPHTKWILDQLPKEIPVIHFGTNTNTFLKEIREAGGQVIGVDWRIEIGEAWKQIGYDRALQGNLDPTVLFAPIPEIRKKVKEILDQTAGRPGHIFNLGHGILPATPVDHVVSLIEMVHEISAQAHKSTSAQGKERI